MLPATACDEITDFIVAGKTAEQIDAFRPSDRTQARIAHLLEQSEMDSLSQAERAELDDFLQLEHLIDQGQSARLAPADAVTVSQSVRRRVAARHVFSRAHFPA